ncbi:unnamed protein product [Calypogeia fissa]
MTGRKDRLAVSKVKYVSLSKPVYEMMEKRPEAMNAKDRTSIRAENNFKSGGFESLSASFGSANDQPQLSPDICLNMHTEQGHCLPRERSRSTATQSAATFSSKPEHSNQPESSLAEGLGFEDNIKSHTSRKKSMPRSMQTNNSGPSLRPYASRLLSELKDPQSPKTPARSTRRNLDARMDGPVRRLDFEFSRLSARVKRRWFPFGKEVMQEITLSAISSYVRQRMNADHVSREDIATKMEKLVQRRFSARIDCRIRNAANRFAAELERASKELAEEVVEKFYSCSSSKDGAGARQSPFKNGRRRH